MESQQLKELIVKELPTLIQQDSSLREWVLKIGRTQFADQAATESRFDQMIRLIQQQLDDNRQLRDEQNRKWDEQNRKWEANQQVINQMLESIRKLDNKYDQTLGALGTRWGLHSEETFRNAISGILQTFPSGVEVIHVNEFDDRGEVFGRPDQIELDLIIRNGQLLIAEIKSSMSRADMYLFERKVRFYEKRHQRTAQQLIVISPMVDKKAQEVAAKLGITVYSYTDEVKF
ncbi:MAG: DUF3782 domain-containing protein [Thioploca sp.]|nr:DUF3782 domain-containing protein [Thioploca sp.]